MPAPDPKIASEPLNLESLLNFRVQRLASKMALLTSREVLAGSGVNIAEWRVICRLMENGPLNLTAISRMLGLDPGRTSRLLKATEGKGFIRRYADPEDGRASIFHLTPAARQVFDEVWPRACKSADAFHDLYTDDEHAQLTALLDRAIAYANAQLAVER